MKIAMIGHKRIPSREGGIEVVVEELAVRMVQKGHEVHVYNRRGHHVSGEVYDQNTKKEYKGIHIHTIFTFRSSKLNALVYSLLATLHAIFCRYDVIHYHAEGPCAMIWLPHLLKIPTVATIHGLDWKRAKWGGFASKFLKFGEKMAVSFADEIIVLSKNVQEYFAETYQRKTIHIPNGVNQSNIQKASIITKKYGLEKDDYILFLARIVPEKGLHYLLEAFCKSKIKKKLVVAGGSSHTDQYFEKIKRIAMNDPSIVMTGFVQGEELEELYSNAYLYILPSDIEGMPISLLEAMSYGNCCVVSDIPENIEVVEDKAFSFRKGNVEDLTKVLIKCCLEEREVKEKKKISRSFIEQKYDWNHVVDQILKLYGSVI